MTKNKMIMIKHYSKNYNKILVINLKYLLLKINNNKAQII